jgi:hypothetical protein
MSDMDQSWHPAELRIQTRWVRVDPGGPYVDLVGPS